MNEATNGVVMISVDMLNPHPDNPRKEVGDVTELADSIKANGILQNLTVVPYYSPVHKRVMNGMYTVIIGHRRLAASKLAGLTEVPCIIREMTMQEQVRTMLMENMQRSDLTVYEQAHGFQMMIDLGATVEQVAADSGFSKTTVRRRLKMMELDQSLLKEVSGRQTSLFDFDRLAQIDDIKSRNECLSAIGTHNFNYEIEKRLKKQNFEKNLPIVKKALRTAHAKKLERGQTYGWEYEKIQSSEVAIDKLESDVVPIPAYEKDLFYYINDFTGELTFYKKREKEKPVRRPQAEIDREKAVKEANEKCKELSELFRSLREKFVDGLTLNSRNRDAMLNGALSAIIALSLKYGSPSSSGMYKLAGMEMKYVPGEKENVIKTLKDNIQNVTPGIIYSAFCDFNEFYHTTYTGQWPAHNPNFRLDLLYDWLISTGYEMSDDETALRNGTHELFTDPVKN